MSLCSADKVLVESVRRILQDVFPQIDSRILWGVARQHFNDADVAVGVVLTEIIPNLKEQPQSLAASSSSSFKSSSSAYEDGDRAGKPESSKNSTDNILGLPKLLSEAGPSSVNDSLPIATRDVNAGFSSEPNSPTVVEPVVSEALDKALYHDNADGETDVVGDGEPIVLLRKRRSYDDNVDEHVEIGGENVESMVESVVTNAEVSGSIHNEVTHDLNVFETVAEDNYIHLNVNTLKFIDPANKELDLNSSESAYEENAITIENVNSGNESLVNKDEKCSIELLEEVIEDVRDKKKTLMLTMNSVVDLRKEVEQIEKDTEQIKEQVTHECANIYSKVDEIKQTLRLAKEANDMHAGEVYAEKAILSTEYKEFRHQLFTFSDEIDMSLEMYNEMLKNEEIRLATAREKKASAEEEKLKKVMTARDALLHEETEVEKVVEESKKLKLVAEENSKEQEFLTDHVRAFDILTGEVAILKENFEKRIPLSRSLSSSQTSSVLASTNSSFRSTTTITPFQSEFVSTKKCTALDDSYGILEKSSRSEVPESPKSPINTGAYFLCGEEKLDKSSRSESPTSSTNTGAYFLSGAEKEKRVADRKKLLEDGWELFENGDLFT